MADLSDLVAHITLGLLVAFPGLVVIRPVLEGIKHRKDLRAGVRTIRLHSGWFPVLVVLMAFFWFFAGFESPSTAAGVRNMRILFLLTMTIMVVGGLTTKPR
jgi:hypothetical protein